MTHPDTLTPTAAAASAAEPVHHTDLDQRLGALISEWSDRPFEWGISDCCQFARSAAWVLHGIAVDAPPYISERDAARALERMGGYEGLLTGAGLQRRRALLAARRGDFVIFQHDGPGLFPRGLALVTGTHAHAPTERGLISLPKTVWVDAWGAA